MRTILLSSLFTGLLLSANFSMANSKIELAQSLPATSVEATIQNKQIIDEMVQSKLNTQIIHLASIETAKSTQSKESKKEKSEDLGYDSYAFE